LRFSRGRSGRGRFAAGVAAAVVLVGLVGVSCRAGAPASAGSPAARAGGSPATAGAQLWVRSFGPPASAAGLVASPDGGAVFVTGPSRVGGVIGYATIGYDAGTGAQLWASRFKVGGSSTYPPAIAVSPDGGTVFVTGASTGAGPDAIIATTIAYHAATGRQVWAARYSGGVARALVVSPDGKTVYVTGYAYGLSAVLGYFDYVTIAYDAATGARRWLARYSGPANRIDQARSIAISPDGQTLFVTGRSWGTGSRYDYATVAYAAATGRQRWASRYNDPANGTDFASGVAAAPGGTSVYVTGGSANSTRRTPNPFARDDLTTVAYDAATGAQRWVARYNDKHNGGDEGGSVAVTPDGRTVIAAGPSYGTDGTGYATVAYHAATGAPAWTRRALGYPVGVILSTQTLAVSPDSSTVYVTGPTPCGFCDYNYGTIAFAVATGTQRWMSRYNGPGKGDDNPSALALSPDGGTVFVTGMSTGVGPDAILATTIAYRS
jgi:hypothetical protein